MARPNKDPLVENAIAMMNDGLAEVEKGLIDVFTAPEHPIVFVVGTQRSGTTVLTQSLATLYRIAYPSNLVARFWRAPYLGALVSQSLGIDDARMSFQSRYGATTDPAGPHEFSYFWRHWFPGSAQHATPFVPSVSQQEMLQKHFAAWQSVGDQPLLFKNLLEVIPNIGILADMFPTALFLNIQREDLFVVQSTFECRKTYSGNYDQWFGVKPSNFRDVMKTSDPLLQVVEQVYYVKREIDNSLSGLPESRWMNVNYERFVADPVETIDTISSKFALNTWRRNERLVEDLDLHPGNRVRFSEEQIESVQRHWRTLERL